jgi:tetratricopeptide (TPR) repeat protein
MAGAANAFRATLKLDPAIPRNTIWAGLAEKGDYPSAREILNAIPRDDRQYDVAQRLLAEIAAKEPGQSETQPQNEASREAADAQAQFLDGQLRFQSGQYGAALKIFEQALQGTLKAEWTAKAQIYRAISLEKLGRTTEAEAAMQALSEKSRPRKC